MNKLTIGIADMKMARGEGVLITYALGSCIGICLYDPVIRLGALVHIMLPLNMETGRRAPMKYADTGIRETLKKMEEKGALRSRVVAKIAGGAKMFATVSNSSIANIGQRNVAAVKEALRGLGIPILAEDTGRDYGRTLFFSAEDGSMRIKSAKHGERVW